MAAVILLFAVESLLGMETLTLSPVLGLVTGMVFFVKAGVLAGFFYISAVALMACGVAMAWMQRIGCPYGLTLFGIVAGLAFLLPGYKYYRQSQQTARAAA